MKLLRLPILTLLAYAFVLMGCGQKGPLYLPEKQTTPVITTETAQPVQDTTKAEQTEETPQPPASSNEAAQ